ncbi:thioredoxin-disulfide reductase [Membranihabitans marinus]|uniref:thioredoxin-disulfide reductase n=1 Tax=Membranihabitans marinus TaxID=1227546 RepID=UPI001F02C9AB|nr:thioredoxin-disulfide reductase [Membranihabitans marinus]
MDVKKCVIIGSGPAGYTAAIYAARANMDPILYTGGEPGGQLTITTEVENYPGFPEGIQGPQMMEEFRKQAERFDTQIHYNLVNKVDFSNGVHSLTLDNGETIHAHTVIISTGASARWLGLPSEKKYMNLGVSACAVCDGFFFRGKDVAVVGGGDTALEEASYLAKLCPVVHLLVRRDEFRASKAMQARVLNNDKIKIHWNTEALEVLGTESEVTGMKVINNKTQEVSEIAISGFFVAIGHTPNTKVFADFINLDENGYIVTEGKSTKTNVEGVFASGDAQDHIYRQAVTAAGTGCMAALDAERYLVEKGII